MNTEIGKSSWVNGYPYKIGMREDGIIILTPESGDVASSDVGWDDYRYTHGGETYQDAVDRAFRIQEMIRKQEQPKKVCDCCGQMLEGE